MTMQSTDVDGEAAARSEPTAPHRALRNDPSQATVVDVGGVPVGGRGFVLMAGPCAVETAELTGSIARTVRRAGGHVLRGGVFKPRTSPYAFQGLGLEGLSVLADAAGAWGLPVVTEVLDAAQIPRMAPRVDLFQVGARNMQNFALLRALAASGKPVLLKRGMSATISEWLFAAEYLLDGGNPHVVLCERGIRTFEPATRNTLDLAAVALVKQMSHLPVLVDPSHGTGRRELVIPMCLAAAAAGADGLVVDVHPHPPQALCDGAQALSPELFEELVRRLGPVLDAVGRPFAARPSPLATSYASCT